jgi:hypothetical protein
MMSSERSRSMVHAPQQSHPAPGEDLVALAEDMGRYAEALLASLTAETPSEARHYAERIRSSSFSAHRLGKTYRQPDGSYDPLCLYVTRTPFMLINSYCAVLLGEPALEPSQHSLVTAMSDLGQRAAAELDRMREQLIHQRF